MSLASVIALINANIVPNDNNEITADVLRPILLAMLQQPNELIGDLSNLTVEDVSDLVSAINELNQSITNSQSIQVYQGEVLPQDSGIDPNPADFYHQISPISGTVDFFVFRGDGWMSLDSFQSVRYTPQPLTPVQRETVHANLDIYSTAQVDDLISNATPRPKIKDLFTKTLTEIEIVGGDVKLDLPYTPNQREWYDLHINTSWVKPTSYEIINENQLAIYGDRLPYSLKAGAEVIFQYTYTDV